MSSFPTLAAAAALALLASPVTSASAGGVAGGSTHARKVRALDAQAELILETGTSHSETVRALVQEIEDSDVIVMFQTGIMVNAVYPGRTSLMAATPFGRYVRIMIDGKLVLSRAIELFAHELVHATEITQALEVQNDATFAEYFRRIGTKVSTGEFETEDAIAAETRVRAELAVKARRERAVAGGLQAAGRSAG